MCRPRRKMSGHIFIFRGHSDSQVKLLWSTSDGLCILTIRLEGIDWRYPSAKTAHYRTGDTETLSAGKTGRPGAGNRPSAGATGQTSSDELRPLFRKGIPPYHTNGNRSEPGAEKTLTLLVEWITRQYSVRRSSFVIIPLREKHACTKFGAIVQVPAPSRPIEWISQDWRC